MTDNLQLHLHENLSERLKDSSGIAVSDSSGYLSNQIFATCVISLVGILEQDAYEKSIVVVGGSNARIANLIVCYAALLAGKTFCCLNEINYKRLKNGSLGAFESYIDLTETKVEQLVHSQSTSCGQLPSMVSSNNPAYIVYTSGSTGKPKGIIISRNSFSLYVSYINGLLDTSSKKDFMDILSSPLFFDNAVFNIAIMCGSHSHTHIVNALEFSHKWRDSLVMKTDYKFYITYGAPSIIKKFARSGFLLELFGNKKGIVGFGGEGYSWQELKENLAILNNDVELFNFYGPSECTCMCSYFRFRPNDIQMLYQKYKCYSAYPPLGTIFPYFEWKLVSSDAGTNINLKNQESVEMFGELALHGGGLMQNYLENKGNEPIKEYLTGDICLAVNDLLFFKGRRDNQFKINGIRIELEEIDAILNGIACIKAAASIIVEDRFKYIVAYISLHANTSVSDAQLRAKIKSEIGTQKCPAIFIRLNKIPLNLNGKIDRKVLEKHYKQESNLET